MNTFWRTIRFFTCVIAALGAGAWFYFQSLPGTPLLFQMPWPRSNANSTDSVSLNAFRGKVLVVNFWATWCAPCVKEMPDLDKLRKELIAENIQNFEIVGIGIDSDEKVAQFLAKTPINYPLFTAGAAGAELAKHYGNEKGFLPFTVILNADGSVAQRKLGVLNIEELRHQIRQMFRKS